MIFVQSEAIEAAVFSWDKYRQVLWVIIDTYSEQQRHFEKVEMIIIEKMSK